MQDVQTILAPKLTEVRRVPLPARPLMRLGLLVAVIAAAHGYSLTAGLWLDDHLHYKGLRDAHWSYRDLIDASTLDNTTTHFQLWGTMDNGLRFYRPVAFGLMKAEYTLVGWQPAPMHVFNLTWHLAAAMLIGALVSRLLNDGMAGTFAAVLFAAFPNHVATVYWIACQTELMVTTFILVAVLAYAKWAGWSGAGYRGQVTGDRRQETEDREHETRDRGQWTADGAQAWSAEQFSWLMLTLVAFVLALGCRENAIVLPGILVAGDILTGRAREWRRRLPAWLLLAMLAAVYLVLRRLAMGGMAWPPRPYLTYPSDPGFLQFAARKVLYYLSGLFIYLPILPGSAASYFAEKTWLLPIGAAVSLLVPVTAVLLWRRWIVLLGAVWIVLIFMPSIGVALSPHHLYLPGVGAALLLTAAVLGLWRTIKRHLGLQRAEPYVSGILATTLLACSLLACFVTSWLYINGTAAEDQVVADVLQCGDPLSSGDELFFINLPLMCGWPGPAIETTSDKPLRDLRTYALTLSDEVVMMTQPTEVIPLDPYRLRLQTKSPGWLQGTSGEILAQLAGTKWPFQAGQFVPGPAFDVTVEQIDSTSGGITQLLYVFHEPIDKAGRHFYLGSPYQMAYPLHFDWDRTAAVVGP